MNAFYIFSIFGWILLGLAHVSFVTLASTVPELASELGTFAPYETWCSGIFYLIWMVAWRFKHKIALWRRPFLTLLFLGNLGVWLKQLSRAFWLLTYFRDFKPYLLCSSLAISTGFTLFLLAYVTFEVANQMMANSILSEVQTRKILRSKVLILGMGGAVLADTLIVKKISFAANMMTIFFYVPLCLAVLFVAKPRVRFARKK